MFWLNVCTGIGADWAAFSCRRHCPRARRRPAQGLVTEHPSVRAEAGGAGLGGPHGCVVHDHSVHHAVSLLSWGNVRHVSYQVVASTCEGDRDHTEGHSVCVHAEGGMPCTCGPLNAFHRLRSPPLSLSFCSDLLTERD